LLRGLEKLGLVWDLKVYPEAVYAEAEQRTTEGGRVE